LDIFGKKINLCCTDSLETFGRTWILQRRRRLLIPPLALATGLHSVQPVSPSIRAVKFVEENAFHGRGTTPDSVILR